MNLPPILSRVAASGIDPVKIHKKTACVFGVGGLGALVAEMLVRVGIGKIILVDRDIVGEENLNRLGFLDRDIGKPKVEALRRKLMNIASVRGTNFPLEVEAYRADVIAWEKLPEIMKKCDIVFTCFDNLEARLEINYWAIQLRKNIVDGGTSDNGLRGRVISVIPGKTPCLGCYFDTGTLFDLSESDTESTGSCNASLPTTMAIVAAIQLDQGLRISLNMPGIVPKIIINLEDEISLTKMLDLKPRKNCRFCGVLNHEE